MAKPAVFSAPRLSPDGKRLALLVLEGTNQGISIYDEQRESVTRLTSSAEVYRGPVWSPDGRHIIFSTPNGTFSIRADGAGPRQSLTPGFKTPASFAPDGKRLAYAEINRANGGAGGIWTVSIEDDGNQLRAGKPEPFLQTQSTEGNPMFSPDGRWLAYQSDETGTNEVNVRAFPAPVSGPGSKWQISTAAARGRSGCGTVLASPYTSGRSDHGRELHGEWRRVRGGQTSTVVEVRRRDRLRPGP